MYVNSGKQLILKLKVKSDQVEFIGIFSGF